jgi:hypothetical protein
MCITDAHRQRRRLKARVNWPISLRRSLWPVLALSESPHTLALYTPDESETAMKEREQRLGKWRASIESRAGRAPPKRKKLANHATQRVTQLVLPVTVCRRKAWHRNLVECWTISSKGSHDAGRDFHAAIGSHGSVFGKNGSVEHVSVCIPNLQQPSHVQGKAKAAL